MAVNGITSSTAQGLQIVHNVTDLGTDKRRCVAQDSNSNIYKGWIADDFTIAIQKNSETIGYTTAMTGVTATSDVLIWFDRLVQYCYVLFRNTGTGQVNLNRITVSTMALLGDTNLVIPTTPLKTLITTQGDKIVWLGDNSTLYSMDLDGGNLLSLVLPYIFTSVASFSLSTENVVFIQFNQSSGDNDSSIAKVNISSMTVSYYDIDTEQYTAKSGFVYGEYMYFVSDNRLTAKSAIIKQKIITWNTSTNLTIKNITSSNGIERYTVKKFNLGYNTTEAKYYGYLAENNGLDRQILWQYNLDTGEMLPLQKISLTKVGDITTFVGSFSGVAGTAQRIVMDGANDDIFGGEWATVTGGI